jgi:hypothetical protein
VGALKAAGAAPGLINAPHAVRLTGVMAVCLLLARVRIEAGPPAATDIA